MNLDTASANFQAAATGGNQPAAAPSTGSNPGGDFQPSSTAADQNDPAFKGQGTNDDVAAGKSVAELLDLDSHQKFKFQGKEWTPEELHESILRQQDYTKKTQAIAQERKYYANLQADLREVRQNPALADEFRKIYPAQFHAYLDVILEQSQSTQQGQPGQGQQSYNRDELPPAVQAALKRLEKIEAHIEGQDKASYEQQVSSIEKDLGNTLDGLNGKYQFAVEEAVLTKAEALIAKGHKLTAAAWERLYQANHEANLAKWQKYDSAQKKEQLKRSQEGADIGRGGGAPGAGRKAKTIGDATEEMIRSLTGKP